MRSVWETNCGTVRMISFTSEGHRRNALLKRLLDREGIPCRGYRKGTAPGGEELLEVSAMYDWVKEGWGRDAYIFIGAAGIAVRSIAPFIKDKFTDSPVLAMDEKGRFIIPLLSSHLGGAADLAVLLADLTKAEAVVTTATDLNGKFAVDVFAKENGMEIADRELARRISALVLQGKQIGFYSEFQAEGEMPEELLPKERLLDLEAELPGIAVLASHPKEEHPGILYLYPKVLSIGIGCKRGITKEKIEEKLGELLDRDGYGIDQIRVLASIDRKGDEEGILAFAEEHGILFQTYTAEELNTVEGVTSSSEFVRKITGTDNVCERAALLAGKSGELIDKKETFGGLTLAAVRMDCRLVFGRNKGRGVRMSCQEEKGDPS